jgi:hypothetical protein
MKAHKFLAPGARGPLSGCAWPAPGDGAPGAWVQAEGPLAPCARGVHVCRAVDLPYWIHDELWEVEAEGEFVEGTDCVVVRRARLVHRVAAWDGPGARRFAEACVSRVETAFGPAPAGETRALLEDARFMAANGYVALAAFTAAVAVGRARAANPEQAYRSERGWQAGWIARELVAPRA